LSFRSILFWNYFGRKRFLLVPSVLKMGALLSCCRDLCGDKDGENYQTIQGTQGKGSEHTPDPEERRRQLAEAAEKRRAQEEHRGVKDIEKVRRTKQRSEQRDQLEEEMARRGQGQAGDPSPLQWTVS
jgi:small VCP/p97-interacting protein